jgi:hypothetical protein
MERAILDSSIVAGPLINKRNSKQRVCNVSRRSDKGAKDKLKKCGAKLEGEKLQAAG